MYTINEMLRKKARRRIISLKFLNSKKKNITKQKEINSIK